MVRRLISAQEIAGSIPASLSSFFSLVFLVRDKCHLGDVNLFTRNKGQNYVMTDLFTITMPKVLSEVEAGVNIRVRINMGFSDHHSIGIYTPVSRGVCLDLLNSLLVRKSERKSPG